MIRNITIIVDSIDRNEGSGAKANIAFIESLAASGYKLTVYHYTRKNILLPNVTCITIPEKKWSLLFVFSRIQRILARWTSININPLIENMFGFSLTYFNDVKSIRKHLQSINASDADLIITLSQGASFRPHYALLKLPQLHTKWLAYVHDPYPFHYYPRPYNWVERGHRQKEAFFQEVSEKARYSGFPSLLLREWMGSYFPQFITTGLIIPHQLGLPVETFAALPDYFNKKAFSVLHAGNLMKQRNPSGLIVGFQLFLKRNPTASEHAQLLLIGPADYHQQTIHSFKLSTPSLLFINENVPFDTVMEMQKQASANVILESQAEISPFLPGKFPHCVMADKPIISLAPYYSETKRLLGDDYPYWSEQQDSEKIATILDRLYGQWKKNAGMLTLNRPDLANYLSHTYLRQTIDTL
ncbi:MAG: UDP-glycosyltransferase [Bacteroidota bacterium]